MTASFVTVEQAAEHLGLHPKTVLRYIRDGRLPATRVGKSYRIVRAELDAFAGVASGQPAVVLRTTCIVEILSIAVEKAERLATFLQSTVLARRDEASPLQLQTAFDPIAGGLKVVLIGEPATVANLLEMLQLRVEAG
jgi:excisionase family DNA binding protein